MKSKILIFYQNQTKSDLFNNIETFLKNENFELIDSIKYPLRKYQNNFLSSKIDPEKEAKRLINSLHTIDENFVIIHALTNLFYLENILLMETYKDFLIIDISPKLLEIIKKHFSDNIDITIDNVEIFIKKLKDNYSDKNIIILINPDKELLKQTIFNIEKTKVLEFSKNKISSLFFQKFKSTLTSILNQKSINSQTISKFGFLWIKNSLLNLTKYIVNTGINFFIDFAKGIDIVIVGGGPSLFFNMENLKKIQPYVIIICVDTALRPLLKNNIIPDFVISFDSQSINSAYILSNYNNFSYDYNKNNTNQNNVNKNDINNCNNKPFPILITVPTVNPNLVKKYKGKIAFSSIFFNFIQKIDEISGPKFEILSGGTVTSSAYDFAKLMNPDNIYFLGLDLCYSYNLNHCKNSLYEDFFYYWQNYVFTYEKYFLLPILNGTTYFDYDLAGRKVRTDLKFKMFSDWFSNEINNKTFFLSDRVLKNDKFIYKSFDNIIKKINSEKKSDSIYKIVSKKRKYLKNIELKNKINSNQLNKLIKFLQKILKELYALNHIFLSAYKLSLKMKDFFNKGYKIDTFLYNLELFEKNIKNYSFGLYIINLASQKTINEIQQNYKEGKSNIEIINENIYFYSSMLKYSNEIIKTTKTAIKNIDKLKIN